MPNLWLGTSTFTKVYIIMLKKLVTILLTSSMLLSAPSAYSNIMGLDIGGTLYDVTFHSDPAAFKSIWDPNGDLNFSDSSLGHAPTFWADSVGANAAAIAIIGALGSTGTTIAPGVDGFIVPYWYLTSVGFGSTPTTHRIHGPGDTAIDLVTESLGTISYAEGDTTLNTGGYAWTSFSFSSLDGSVPEPTTPALMFAGLLAVWSLCRPCHTE